jgi:site-specific recombinase XerD
VSSNAHLIDLYDAYLQAGSLSPGTRALKRNYLERFGATHDLQTCTASEIVEWLSANPTWKPSTRRSARSAVKTFFSWARKMGHREDDPAADTMTVRVPPGAPKPCPESVLEHALATADERGRLAILLGAYAGLRRAEIATLHADMVDLEAMTLRVTGKGGRTRIVPIAEALVAPLTEAKARGGYLFPNGSGHITPTTLGRIVKPYLGPGLSTHTLRHRFATRVYAGSRNLRATQELLGHASIATTERYTAVTDTERREAVAGL